MTAEEENKRFGPMQHLCVSDGMKFSPIYITIGPKSNDKYKFSLPIQLFNMFKRNCCYLISILPADDIN